MNKLIFKLFYSRIFFGIFFVFLIVLMYGCNQITGKATEQIPKEINKKPEVYFCQVEDCGKVYEMKIKSANFTVHCALYDIDLKNVINALAQKSRIDDVKLVMDISNYNGQIKGDGARFNDGNHLMHNKFCVIDESIVLTGSFNPTDNDNYLNNNNVVAVYSTTLAKNYEYEFEELWNGKFGKGYKVEYPILQINDVQVENFFCPEDCPLELSSSITKGSGLYKIIDLIKNAKESVKVASFTFSHEGIADELVKAQARGINVTILIENRQRNVQNSQYQRLKEHGLNIKLDGNKYNMHHKFMIIDGKIVETGSPNFTSAGFSKNDENMLIIHDNEIAEAYSKEFERLWANSR